MLNPSSGMPAAAPPRPRELGPMLRLAGPVVLAEAGWMAMGTVDTMCVGRLNAEAMAAVGLGNSVFMSLAIVGMGLLFGLDTLVSQAIGAGRPEQACRAFVQGLYLASLLAIPIAGAIALIGYHPEWLGSAGTVRPLVGSFLKVAALGLPPLLLYTVLRRYLQALGHVGPILFALFSANGLNLAANWVLIYGHLGFPALGVAGSAWATVLARVWIAAVLVFAVVRLERRSLQNTHFPWGYDRRLFRGLVSLGAPAAGQLALEFGIFGAAAVMAGWINPEALAAHQVALTVSALSYMVPLGITSAAAVRVGLAVGRGDPRGAAHAGWSALGLGAAFMALAAGVMILFPRSILATFTDQPDVIRSGVALLALAAVFQLFDGLQVVATGALRGLGDTRTPMLVNLLGYWAIAMPLAWWLAFRADFGVRGLWIGLCIGLILVGTTLLWVWWQRSSRATATPMAALARSPAEG